MILSKLSFYHKILILSIIVFANSMIKGYAQQKVVDSLNRTIQMLEDQQKLLRDELDIHSRLYILNEKGTIISIEKDTSFNARLIKKIQYLLERRTFFPPPVQRKAFL